MYISNILKTELDEAIRYLLYEDTTSVIDSIDIAKYCVQNNNVTEKRLDLYIKIKSDIRDYRQTEDAILQYNYMHKNNCRVYLIVDFVGPDEAKGYTIWQNNAYVTDLIVHENS